MTTVSNAIQANNIDTVTGTGLTIGNGTATSVLLGSSTVGRTPTITIDTLSTLNTNANPAIAIGTSASTKTIKINNATSSVHCSSLDIAGSGINNIVNTTGQVDIAQLQTGGTLNIGTNGSRTADINVGSATNTGKINLLTVNTGTTDGSPAISIGTNTGAKLIKIGNNNSNNTVNLARLQVAGQDIQPIDTTGGTITLGYNQTVGLIYIGGGNNRTATASININTGSTCSSVVNINTGTGASQSSTTNIGTGTTTGTVTIGNTNNTTAIGGNLSLSQPLTYSYTTGISPSSSQLGYRSILHSIGSVVTSASSGVITAPTSFNLPIGVWIISAIGQASTNSSYITTSIKIASGGLTHDTTNWCVVANVGANPTLNNNATLINATAGAVSYNYLVQANSVSVTIGSIYVIGTRIA